MYVCMHVCICTHTPKKILYAAPCHPIDLSPYKIIIVLCGAWGCRDGCWAASLIALPPPYSLRQRSSLNLEQTHWTGSQQPQGSSCPCLPSPVLDCRCLQRSLHIVSGDWTHTLMSLSWLCQLPSPKNCSLEINTLFRTPLFCPGSSAGSSKLLRLCTECQQMNMALAPPSTREEPFNTSFQKELWDDA